jgi:hypothetical protein
LPISAVDAFVDEAPVIRRPDQLAEVREVDRPPVGGQRHDLVLVAGPQEAEVLGEVFVEQAQRVRQPLRGEHLQAAVDVVAGQVRGALAAPVEHEACAAAHPVDQWGREARGRRVRDVVGHEADEVGVAELVGGRAQRRVEGVGHGVEVRGPQPGLREAPAHRELGQLPRGERDRPLAVLAAAEALLLGGRDDPPVDDEGRRGIVEDRVHTQDLHTSPPPSRSGTQCARAAARSPRRGECPCSSTFKPEVDTLRSASLVKCLRSDCNE